MLHSRLLRIACLVLFGLLLGLSTAFAASQEVELSADNLVFDREQGNLKAQGDVRIKRGDTELRADRARYDEATGDVFCEGGVTMTAPQGNATAEALQYNFDSGTGVLTNGSIELPGLAYLSGSEIRTLGNDSYRITDGKFTACEGEPPAWSFGAEKLDVRFGYFAKARNAKFYIHDVPVLYLPYIAFPAKTDRSSGLLMPTVGFSSQRGTQFVIPWFQAIDVDQDLTFTLDTMSRIGVGTGLDYRYFFNTVRPARLNGNYVAGITGQPDRYLLEWQHDGPFLGGSRIAADMQYVNKSDYFELFGGSPQEYTSDKVQSNLYLSKIWNKTNLTGLGRYTRALKQETSTVFQTLPKVGLTVVPQRLFDSPLVTSLQAEVAHFWRHEGSTGTRFLLNPVLSTDLFSTRSLNLLPSIGWHELVYQSGSTTDHFGRPELSVVLGNRFARIYTAQDGRSADRHAVELQMVYDFAPRVETAGLPKFDFRDDLSPLNRFRLILGNRWTTRRDSDEGGAIYRDLANLRLSTGYDLYEQRRSLGPSPDRHDPLMPLAVELELRPDEKIYLRGDAEIALEQSPGRLDSLEFWGGTNDAAGNGLMLNYSFSRGGFEYAAVSLDLAILSPFYLNYEGRFDLQERQNLDYRTSLEYRSGCWSIAGHWYERPGDRTVSVSFSLSNITGKTIRPLTQPLDAWL